MNPPGSAVLDDPTAKNPVLTGIAEGTGTLTLTGSNAKGSTTKATTVTVFIVHVPLDFKPGSCPNPMRLKCTGVLPIAILGTDKFDVTTMDPATIMIKREGVPGGVPILRT